MDGQSSLYKLPKKIEEFPSINYSTKKLANVKIINIKQGLIGRQTVL